MLTLTCKNLELRGLVPKTNVKTGNVYYILYVESNDGVPYNFFVKDSSSFAEGLKRGDIVTVTFNYSLFNNEVRLNVSNVRKEV